MLPTNAPYPFYDPQQLEPIEPRKGTFTIEVVKGTYQRRVTDGAIKIERAWADVRTQKLQDWIDMFMAEVLRRALAGEDEAIETFALRTANLVNWLQSLTSRQREKVKQLAARVVFWPVNVTQRDMDFTWAKKYVREVLQVGSKSLLSGRARSRIDRRKNYARLAEILYQRLLTNRHKLPELLEEIGKAKARKPKWISLCLSLPAVKGPQEITPQDAPKWWQLGEALLLEAWETDRRSAFGSVLTDPIMVKGWQDFSDAAIKRDIFKQIKSAFFQLLKSGMSAM
jgi:hypothetical protein